MSRTSLGSAANTASASAGSSSAISSRFWRVSHSSAASGSSSRSSSFSLSFATVGVIYTRTRPLSASTRSEVGHVRDLEHAFRCAEAHGIDHGARHVAQAHSWEHQIEHGVEDSNQGVPTLDPLLTGGWFHQRWPEIVDPLERQAQKRILRLALHTRPHHPALLAT